jgi:anti-sigma regulatory factor (Ser/Thr protein kinase)
MSDPDTDRLELLADPNAVRQARAWLKARLDDWSPDGVATVQLLVSELVTNAILHTDDVVEVTAERNGAGITVEVSDRSPTKPVVKRYEQDAATGRGLHLVEALADAWGVRGDDARKSVWFRVVDGTPHSALATGATADWPALDSVSGSDDQLAVARGVSRGAEVRVCLRGLPVAVYLAAEEHHDALMREFGMLLRSHADRADANVTARLLELAEVLAKQFGVGNELRRAQVETARRAGVPTVDVEMLFPVGGAEQVVTVADQLDEVDGYCEEGQLLTPPSSASVKRFRRWYTEEVVRQLEGRQPTPWTDPVTSP